MPHCATARIMRGLVMDFPHDVRVRNLGDEYLFGPSFLVSPVYEYQARTRKVYLPAGTEWTDFYTGKTYTGGQQIRGGGAAGTHAAVRESRCHHSGGAGDRIHRPEARRSDHALRLHRPRWQLRFCTRTMA